jgi:tRNA threonylcarbamoyl adenosine modification protein YeaZ
MKILAVEFSSVQRSVAVLGGGGPGHVVAQRGGKTVPAFEMIGQALAKAGLEREEIECVAVGIGPGSYTGVRAAIALAQGWQLARSVKLLGIGSVECLALEAQREGWFGMVNIVMDAQRKEFYLARYEISAEARREIAPLKLATFEELAAHVRAGELVAGPEADKWFEGGRVLFPNAAALGMLAMGRSDFVDGEKLEPIYLRETNYVKAPPLRILPAG